MNFFRKIGKDKGPKRDKFGVVHVYANDQLEAFNKWGYAHADDRFFQMDLLRRKAAGNLSQIFGKSTLQVDINQKFFGFEALSKDIYYKLSPAEKEILKSYSLGVNRWIPKMVFSLCENLSCINFSLHVILPCVTITPRGWLVDPEVYCKYAISSILLIRENHSLESKF